MKPRLGICLPVYKRPALLEKCLESIFASIGKAEVSVYVSDDSCDGTNDAVLEKFSKRYPNFHVSKNEKNLGIDGNICKAIDMAETDFAWPIGEDDRLRHGAVAAVLERLDGESRGASFLFSNYEYVDNRYRWSFNGPVLKVQRDELMGAERFFREHSWAIGFIGACVVDRRLWGKTDSDRYIGTYYAHVGTIFESIGAKAKVLVIAEPLVLNRAEDSSTFTWSKHAFDVFFGWERMIGLLRGGYSAADKKRALESSKVLFKQRSPLWLVSKRADCIYRFRVFHRYYASDPTLGKGTRAAAYVIAGMPPFLCKAAKILAKDLPRIIKKRRVAIESL